MMPFMHAIRVVHIIDHLGIGGAQQIIDDIIRYSPDGAFEYAVLYFFDRHRYRAALEARGVRVMCLGFGSYTYARILSYLLNPLSYLWIAKFLRKERFDVVHLHLFYAFAAVVPCMLLGRFFGIFAPAKMIYTMHAMKNQVPNFFIFLRMFARIPDVIVGDLPAMVAEMRANRVAARAFAVIHTSTNFSHFPATDPIALREELGIAADERIMVSVGRLHKQKGYRYILGAMPKILKECPRTVLLMVGEGEEMSSLRCLAAALHLGTAARFVGFRPDTVRFYDAADLFVHPATEEALALVVLDAMARGRPVIACRAGALASVVRDGETGYLVERKNSVALADAIIFCLKNDRERAMMGKRAQQLVAECYALDDFVAQYYALYAKMAHGTMHNL